MPISYQRKVRTFPIIPGLFFVSFRGMKPHFWGKLGRFRYDKN